MIVNAGFMRIIRERCSDGYMRKRKREWRNVQGIVVPDSLSWETQQDEIRDVINQHKPGPEWTLQGYALVDQEVTG